MKNNQGFSAVAIIIILAILAGGTYAVWKNQATPPAPTDGSPTSPTELQNDTSDWQTYRNDEYGFEFKYPNKMKLQSINSIDEHYPILLVVAGSVPKEAGNPGAPADIIYVWADLEDSLNTKDKEAMLNKLFDKSKFMNRNVLDTGWDLVPIGPSKHWTRQIIVTDIPRITIEIDGESDLEANRRLLDTILSTFRFTK